MSLVVFSLACDKIQSLRRVLHGEDADLASLTVSIEPTEGLSIFLDGLNVANHSPYTKSNMTPGHHKLEVRAHGCYSFTVPLELQAGANLSLPIMLRPGAPSIIPAPTTR